MYARYSTAPSRNPTDPARTRSSRNPRGSSKRGGGGRRGGGHAASSRIQRSIERGPTKKFVKVKRPPAPKIRFLVETWVPLADLTEEERQEYGQEQLAKNKEAEASGNHHEQSSNNPESQQVWHPPTAPHSATDHESLGAPAAVPVTSTSDTDNKEINTTASIETLNAPPPGLKRSRTDEEQTTNEPSTKRARVDEESAAAGQSVGPVAHVTETTTNEAIVDPTGGSDQTPSNL